MGLLVVAKSGVLRGSYWTLGERPIVVGRSSSCDIVLPDRMVSRRQCVIESEGSALVLTDLASSNTSLVNGAPVRRATLSVGDEISVGSSVLMVSDRSPGELAATIGDSATHTVHMSEGMFSDVAPPGMDDFQGDEARSVSDLYTLYLLAASLSEAANLADGFVRVRRVLEGAFEGYSVWLFRNRETPGGEDALQAVANPGGVGEAPMDSVATAIDERMAVMTSARTPGGDTVRTMAAPIQVHERTLGAVVVESRPARATLEERDLKFLAAVCRTLGPPLKPLADREARIEECSFLREDYDAAPRLLGGSGVMCELRATIAEVARAELNVLVVGETGSGKELVARLIHQSSSNADRPFVVVNCPAIPVELFESEVFGHEKGAFTGAAEQRTGLFELADGGILFLDEVGDLDSRNQARLLRSIETGSYRRVGGKEERHADVRVVAATNRDLPEAIRQGLFREDLYHRLSGFEIRVPSLQERRSDIVELAKHFFDEGLRHVKKPLRRIREDAVEYLQAQDWPGNVRQLRNQIQRAMIRAKSDELTVDDFASKPVTPDPTRVWDPVSMADLERRHIVATLEHCEGRVDEAAKLLDISPSTVYRRIREYEAGDTQR